MKQLIRLTIIVSACGALGITAFAGTETYSGKEMKQVAPPPPPLCEWAGLYSGVHIGGQFGHSETFDSVTDLRFGYDESGVVAGGQIGPGWGAYVHLPGWRESLDPSGQDHPLQQIGLCNGKSQ